MFWIPNEIPFLFSVFQTILWLLFDGFWKFLKTFFYTSNVGFRVPSITWTFSFVLLLTTWFTVSFKFLRISSGTCQSLKYTLPFFPAFFSEFEPFIFILNYFTFSIFFLIFLNFYFFYIWIHFHFFYIFYLSLSKSNNGTKEKTGINMKTKN